MTIKPLSADEIWNSDEIMAVNADVDLLMEDLIRLGNAFVTEFCRLRGIKVEE